MWRCTGVMAADAAGRRVRQLLGTLGPASRRPGTINVRLCTSQSGEGKTVTIGDISINIKTPCNPELVPTKYLPSQVPQSVLHHLRWIMQKDVLGQDVFLIGPPGPLRRSLAMMYLEMTSKEVEYVSLSRDTTETDLKQRREIRQGTAFHFDQCAVKAATSGRVLVLEGIEKAERNVLPVLNNLLENREMQLDDGRFLMAADRFDKLLQEHSQEEMDAWNLVRVSEDFRVIALGLPVPRYKGNPLDPPLRSRFQARDVNPLPFKDQLEVLNAVSHGVPPEKLSKILSFAATLNSSEANTLGLPDFPGDNLAAIMRILSACPTLPAQSLLERLYPHNIMLGKEGCTAVIDALKTFELQEETSPDSRRHLVSEVRRGTEGGATVKLDADGGMHTFQVTSGGLDTSSVTSDFVTTPYHDRLLADIMTSHLAHDFCIVGQRGSGKSVIVKQFADMLGYHVEPIMLYQDMTSRDLLQQRMTLPDGDTAWRPSPLVTAAMEGSLAVLDGVHRVNTGTFAVVHRLIHDRELTLFDGTRLLRHDRYEELKTTEDLTDEDLKDRGIEKIHPAFRIIALAEPPIIGSSTQQWLTSEVLTMFLFHHMRALSHSEEMDILNKLVPNMVDMQPIMQLTHKLRASSDTNLKSVAASLSTRQLLRVARRLAAYPGESLYDTIHKACLARFLPRLARNALEEELEALGLEKPKGPASVDGMDRAVTCEIRDGTLRIGNTTIPVHDPDTKIKVPDVLFYENPQHLSVMEAMLKDYLLGEHLLLVGNQGVGKNKVIDRFLFLLNRPREYLQLHRDTTVQTLTLQPTVQDGIILYEDSPLVRAVKLGHILVVDEADKAPTNVTCILKTLVESGEMHLADGRRIVGAHSGIQPSDSVIVAHPDFRMFVLANRPGFPFLGNDFFGAMGDIFSCHAVDNPDTESEMAMLKKYGPGVPDDTLRRLVLAFGELRDMADQGLISYPYSTREVVNMVKHLQLYPHEGLANVVKNVFDFDMYNKEMVETVVTTMQKHGIPVGADPNNVRLAKELELPQFTLAGQLEIRNPGGRQHTALMTCPTEDLKIRIKGPVTVPVESFPLDRTEARSMLFSEQEAFWTLPMHETCVIADVAVTLGENRQVGKSNPDLIHVMTANPVSLYTMNPRAQTLTGIDLYDIFPGNHGINMRPRFHLAPLGFPLDSNVIIYEETGNVILDVNTETGDIRRLETSSFLETASDMIVNNFRIKQGRHRICNHFSQDPEGLVLFYREKSQSIDVLTMLEGRGLTIQLPIKIKDIQMVSKFDWLLTETETDKFYLLSSSETARFDFSLRPIEQISHDPNVKILQDLEAVGKTALNDTLLGAALGEQITSPNRVLANSSSYVSLAVGFPDLSTVDVYSASREEPKESAGPYSHLVSKNTSIKRQTPVALLPQSGHVVRAIPAHHAPKEVHPLGVKPGNLSAYLEVTDITNHKLRYIPVPGVQNTSYFHQLYNPGTMVSLVMAPMSDDGLVTVDSGGCVRLWETALINLDSAMRQWRQLIGQPEGRPLQITYDRDLGGKQASGPKHGKFDPTGAPHVGGNQWGGGTGGRDTAGLGGIGGPYRLDAGHDVHQVSQAAKDNVPEEVQRAAREMGLKAWKERLREIKMSEYDGEMYEGFSTSVRRQVHSLRVILDSLQAKGKERQWLRHQTQGDLDDAKLVEGITGERAIYRRRGEKEPEMGSPQQKPKYVKLLCDVSGSMYRFNGHDGRLERQMGSMLMVMEALENHEHKVKYDIIGHSGEGYHFDFVEAGKPPKNNRERLDVLKTLHAHAQFCISGDHTLEATKDAIKKLADEEADEHFVIVLSDANLDRYGIRPQRFAEILTSDEKVNAYVIFIGSLGNQATSLLKQMPSGHAFICMDTANLPQILQQIFTSTMLNTR